MKISEIMRKNVITCKEDTSVKEVAKMLVENDLTGMPLLQIEYIPGDVDDYILRLY